MRRAHNISRYTFRGMSRDGFAGDPEPVEGSRYDILYQGPKPLPPLPLPRRSPDYHHIYTVVPSAAAARTDWPSLRAQPAIQAEDKRWRNRLLARVGLRFCSKPKHSGWSHVMEERMEDDDVKYECVARATPTTREVRAWTSGSSQSRPGPAVVENRFVVEVGGDRRSPDEDEMRVWREYVKGCRVRGQEPASEVPVEGGALRKMF